MGFFAALSRTRSSAARPSPSCGPASTRVSSGMKADRYSGSSVNGVGYSPSIAAGTDMTRCDGTKTSSATRQLLAVPRIPATYQTSSMARSAAGMRTSPWSITSPSSPVSGAPSAAQVDHQEPELKYHRPETCHPPSTLRVVADGVSTPVTRGSGVPNTSSCACAGKSAASQLHTLTSATTQPAEPSPSATAAETSSIVRSVASCPPYRLGTETLNSPASPSAAMHSSATRRSASVSAACSRSSGWSARARATSSAAVGSVMGSSLGSRAPGAGDAVGSVRAGGDQVGDGAAGAGGEAGMGAIRAVPVDQRRRGPGVGLADRADQQHVVPALDCLGQLAGQPGGGAGQPRQAVVVMPVGGGKAVVRAAGERHGDHRRPQRQRGERAHRGAERPALGGRDDRDLSAHGRHQVAEALLADHGTTSGTNN